MEKCMLFHARLAATRWRQEIAQKEGIFPLGWARCTRCNSGMRLVYDDVTDTMRIEPAELEGE